MKASLTFHSDNLQHTYFVEVGALDGPAGRAKATNGVALRKALDDAKSLGDPVRLVLGVMNHVISSSTGRTSEKETT